MRVWLGMFSCQVTIRKPDLSGFWMVNLCPKAKQSKHSETGQIFQLFEGSIKLDRCVHIRVIIFILCETVQPSREVIWSGLRMVKTRKLPSKTIQFVFFLNGLNRKTTWKVHSSRKTPQESSKSTLTSLISEVRPHQDKSSEGDVQQLTKESSGFEKPQQRDSEEKQIFHQESTL